MTVPTATITLTRGEDSVELNTPPPGYEFQSEEVQALGQTAAGAWYVYDKGITDRRLRMPLLLPLTQRDGLLTFVRTHLNGGVNTFTLTDHYAENHVTCRLLNPTLPFRKTRGALYEVTLEVHTEDDVN